MSVKQVVMAAAGAGVNVSWDLAYAYYDPPENSRWDMSTAAYAQNFSVATQEVTPSDLFFKPDGTKMYVIGLSGRDVNEYSLATAWDISTASYVQVFSVAAQETSPTGLFFKPDGTKMYVIGYAGDKVNEYSLSTAWDISTASYVQNFSVITQELTSQGLFFKPDGTKMYVTGSYGDTVYEYSLSTAWDISTASYVQNFSVVTQEAGPSGLFFKPDGTKMYVSGTGSQAINEYSLSTAWDISTASYVQAFSVSAQDAISNGVFFKPDGSGFYVVGSGSDSVYQYTIGGFSVATQESSSQGLFFKSDGTKMYVLGNSGDDVNEYSLSTAWDISTASYVQVFSVASQETSPTGLFFKPDGTKMYIVGSGGDNVNEYSLSTAWDVSTASYVQVFSVVGQETTATDLFFKPDGTKMYVIGLVGDKVNEYSLSTSWDVSTASYVQNFSVTTQEATSQGLFFKSDGTKMYVLGSTGRDVNEYSLSTSWDVSTASYVQNFSVGGQEIVPNGLFFKDDGSGFYVVGASSDKVHSYSIGVQ